MVTCGAVCSRHQRSLSTRSRGWWWWWWCRVVDDDACRRWLHQCWIGWRMSASVLATWQCSPVVYVAGQNPTLSGLAQIRHRSLTLLRPCATTSTMVLLGCRSLCQFIWLRVLYFCYQLLLLLCKSYPVSNFVCLIEWFYLVGCSFSPLATEQNTWLIVFRLLLV